MKICYLANASSVHTQRWAEAMRDKGHCIDVISFEKAEIQGVNVHYIKPVRREISTNSADAKSLSYMLKAFRVKKIINSIKPDIVHAHYATGYGLTGALCGIKPYIISTWGSDIFLAPKKNRFVKYILNYNFGKADYITATSKNLTQETLLYTHKKVMTIPFGVDTVKFSKQRDIAHSTITLGVVKSLEKVYGICYLIEAFAEISKKFSNVQLLITGDGPEKNDLRLQCKKLNIENKVTFMGSIPNNQVPLILNKIDIFIMPSLSESFGVSILEAEACEIPVVASNVGGIPEVVVNGRTGLLTRPGDSKDIADKLEVLIENRPLREEMGIQGRKFVEENYDWNDCVEQMHMLYQNICSKK